MKKSLRQLAKELEISPAYLSMILSGQRNPNTRLKEKLCSLGLLTDEANLVAHNPKVVGSNPTPATNFKAKTLRIPICENGGFFILLIL